jgi:TPR repeat protein
MYNSGNGVEKDLQMALKYITLSSNHGHDGAHYHLGLMYKLGLGENSYSHLSFFSVFLSVGVNVNLKKSFEYFKLSSDQGNQGAQYFLGCMFEKYA